MPIDAEAGTPKGRIRRELTADEVLKFELLPRTPNVGVVTAFNFSQEKAVTVRYEWMGYIYILKCQCTQDIKDYHGQGKIAVGDTVFFVFIEDDYSRPCVCQKVFKP